ncbi:MAG: hypothetical protein K2O91_24950 [Lachnospiraceae bacterium]|nr:hypothetical protein [Lachnospiraceae bacterium]
MNYYFIDYENVHADGFTGAENLGEKDVICVMYTEQSKAFSLELVEKIARQRAKLESYKAGTGAKNSLDFQLASYLGYMIAKSEGTDDCFYIVSRDTGFNHLVDFWAERNVSVKRIPNFMGEEKDSKADAETAEEELKTRTKPKAKSKSKVSDSNKATKEELLQYLTEEEYSDKILEIFNSYKTRVAINNGLSKEFRDSQKSSAIYKKLKTLLKEKQKS